MNAPEIKEIPRIASINQYLDSSIDKIKRILTTIDESNEPAWEELNKLFLEILRCTK